uniref:Uncharacterized protein n=1 Tax=Aegilops tauschii subsp. strangulata TaxID=200361 RepID=A0A452ZZM9_AEGTS
MLVRLGFVVLATFAAFTLKRGKGPPNKDNGQAKKKEKARGTEHRRKKARRKRLRR